MNAHLAAESTQLLFGGAWTQNGLLARNTFLYPEPGSELPPQSAGSLRVAGHDLWLKSLSRLALCLIAGVASSDA